MTKKTTKPEAKKEKPKVRYINPQNRIAQKVGKGGLPASKIQMAEKIIEENNFDFNPIATELLTIFQTELKTLLLQNKTELDTDKKLLLQDPLMQLKANGAMFQYDLLSEIADITYISLEHINEINQDSRQLLEMEEYILRHIVTQKIKGPIDQTSSDLVTEMDNAVERYRKKYGALAE